MCTGGAATASNTGQSAIFNYFAANATCNLLSAYISTVACSDGMLGYSVPAGGGGAASFETLFYRALCRASPSVMWSFPRAGVLVHCTGVGERRFKSRRRKRVHL